MRFISLLIFLFINVHEVTAIIMDRPNIQSDSATIWIECNRVGTRIFVDSIFIGKTPMEPFEIACGKHYMCLIPPDEKIWLNNAICETLLANSSEIIHKNIMFPSIYYINSDPFGASVKINDSIVGKTPIRLVIRSYKNVISLTKNGYDEAIIPLPDSSSVINYKMEKIKNLRGTYSSCNIIENGQKDYLPQYISLGTSIIAGSAAAYFKIEADKNYKEYKHTNNQLKLRRVERYDLGAGISLAVCEISLIFLSYLLFSQ